MSCLSARTVQLGYVAAAVFGETILFNIMKLCHKFVCYGYGCSLRSFWKCVWQSTGLQTNSAITAHSAMAKTFSEKFSISFFVRVFGWVSAMAGHYYTTRSQRMVLFDTMSLEVAMFCTVGVCRPRWALSKYMQNATCKLIRTQRYSLTHFHRLVVTGV